MRSGRNRGDTPPLLLKIGEQTPLDLLGPSLANWVHGPQSTSMGESSRGTVMKACPLSRSITSMNSLNELRHRRTASQRPLGLHVSPMMYGYPSAEMSRRSRPVSGSRSRISVKYGGSPRYTRTALWPTRSTATSLSSAARVNRFRTACSASFDSSAWPSRACCASLACLILPRARPQDPRGTRRTRDGTGGHDDEATSSRR